MAKKLEDYVISIPDFPEPGIIFRDITSIIGNADGLKLAVDELQAAVKDLDFDVIAGLEARGFIFGMPLAYKFHKPFALIRKKGKLPGRTVSADYSLEYGSVSTLEMQEGAVSPGQKVLLVDDLLATGGTVDAMARLVLQEGGTVAAILVLMELKGLKGREFLHAYDVRAAVSYEGK